MEGQAAQPGEFNLSVTLEGRGSFSASGQADQVFKALKEFREEMKAAQPVERPATKVAADQTTTTIPPKDESAVGITGKGGATGTPLPVFLKVKNPKNNPEAVAVMAVWEKERQGTDVEFTTKSVSDLWRGSSRKPAGNLARDIDAAAKSGWLFRKERGVWVTTEYGEQHVALLPGGKKD